MNPVDGKSLLRTIRACWLRRPHGPTELNTWYVENQYMKTLDEGEICILLRTIDAPAGLSLVLVLVRGIIGRIYSRHLEMVR